MAGYGVTELWVAHPISEAKQRRMVRHAGATFAETSPVNSACGYTDVGHATLTTDAVREQCIEIFMPLTL